MFSAAGMSESFTLKLARATLAVPNAFTGSMMNWPTPSFAMPNRSPVMEASRFEASSSSFALNARTATLTGDVTPDILYSTFTSVDHGHCWRTITCSITAAFKDDAARNAVRIAEAFIVFLPVGLSI